MIWLKIKNNFSSHLMTKIQFSPPDLDKPHSRDISAFLVTNYLTSTNLWFHLWQVKYKYYYKHSYDVTVWTMQAFTLCKTKFLDFFKGLG